MSQTVLGEMSASNGTENRRSVLIVTKYAPPTRSDQAPGRSASTGLLRAWRRLPFAATERVRREDGRTTSVFWSISPHYSGGSALTCASVRE